MQYPFNNYTLHLDLLLILLLVHYTDTEDVTEEEVKQLEEVISYLKAKQLLMQRQVNSANYPRFILFVLACIKELVYHQLVFISGLGKTYCHHILGRLQCPKIGFTAIHLMDTYVI